MEEFFYDETKYIKRQDLKEYVELMLSYDFMPEYIKDGNEFNQVFQYLVNLTLKATNFIVAYEYALSMLELFDSGEDLITLQKDLERRKFEACEKIAKKEKLFDKTVEWGIHENRPLIRGLFQKANNDEIFSINWDINKLEWSNRDLEREIKEIQNQSSNPENLKKMTVLQDQLKMNGEKIAILRQKLTEINLSNSTLDVKKTSLEKEIGDLKTDNKNKNAQIQGLRKKNLSIKYPK